MWALVIAQIGHDWGLYTMLTDLPKYMKEILHFNVKENGLLSSIPYILMWIVSMTSGWICDWLIVRKYLTITSSRKLFTTIGMYCKIIYFFRNVKVFFLLRMLLRFNQAMRCNVSESKIHLLNFYSNWSKKINRQSMFKCNCYYCLGSTKIR